jgi:hypothetical protein
LVVHVVLARVVGPGQLAPARNAATRPKKSATRPASGTKVAISLSSRLHVGEVGHECDSSTAVYTHVSDDFMNTALSRALAPAFAGV